MPRSDVTIRFNAWRVLGLLLLFGNLVLVGLNIAEGNWLALLPLGTAAIAAADYVRPSTPTQGDANE